MKGQPGACPLVHRLSPQMGQGASRPSWVILLHDLPPESRRREGHPFPPRRRLARAPGACRTLLNSVSFLFFASERDLHTAPAWGGGRGHGVGSSNPIPQLAGSPGHAVSLLGFLCPRTGGKGTPLLKPTRPGIGEQWRGAGNERINIYSTSPVWRLSLTV